MATNLEKLDDPRVARFLRDRLGGASWKVEEAKAKLSQIMQKANDGEAQLIGKRNPVLVIGLDELEDLMIGFREPENWGEYFYPPVSEQGIGADLAMPQGRRSAPIDLDAQAGHDTDSSVAADLTGVDYGEIENELQLTRAYAEFGDSDAAAGILQHALDSVRKVRSVPAHYAAGLRAAAQAAPPSAPERDAALPDELASFLAAHPVGSKIEGTIARIEGCWVYIALGALLGMAYTRPAYVARLAAGHPVEAYIVGPHLQKNTVALSLGQTATARAAHSDDDNHAAHDQRRGN